MKNSKYTYHPHQSEIIFNDGDPDLIPITYKLPSPPPLDTIDGYGLPPSEQFFQRQKMPLKLKEIDKLRITPYEKWQKIKARKDYYKDEIAWIKKMWDHRINGYWFFCNGVPTYITGLNFFFLNFWYMDGILPEYRARDRKWHLFEKMCDEDITSYGMVFLKHRREGATSKTACWNYEAISRVKEVHGGIQSKTGKDAKKVLQQHLIKGWRRMPFFFKPITESRDVPKNELRFGPTSTVTAPEYGIDGLESWVDWEEAGEHGYDSTKLFRYHSDEFGKLEGADINERHQIVKPCLSIGNGKAIYTSTVGEMERHGGAKAKILCNNSQQFGYDKNHRKTDRRLKNGQTVSGMYLLFISTLEGFEDEKVTSYNGRPFIDKYGNANTEVIRAYFDDTWSDLRKHGKLKELSESKREFPMYYRDCWQVNAKGCNFRADIIQEKLGEHIHGNPDVIRGNFKRKENEKDGEVYFQPHPEGKFEVSYLFPNPADANRSIPMDGMRFPGHTNLFIAGADPMKYNQTQGKIQSKGAGAVYMKYNPAMDAPNTPVDEMKSDRICCTYNNHTNNKYEYVEDMIMMCVYYGCEMFTEYNVPTIGDGFIDRGYQGYLFYKVDPVTGKIAVNPGAHTGVSLQQEIYTETDTYIERYGMRNPSHDEWLTQCLYIEDDMGAYDLFVAVGYCFLGNRKKSYDPSSAVALDFSDVYEEFNYD